MPIPDFQSIMLPFLRILEDGQEHKLMDSVEKICKEFNLTETERAERLASGNQTKIYNRIVWAKTYLKKAGLLVDPRRGHSMITKAGIELLKSAPERIGINTLTVYEGFDEFRKLKANAIEPSTQESIDAIQKTPDELIDTGLELINDNLAQELIETTRKMDPYLFENVVGKLLSAMGYGKCEITNKSSDGGIDGIVYQDKLGLDRIFFQAKRYQESNTVTAKDVRDFVGTLDLNGVSKGVFFTTSRFPKNTLEILHRTPKTVILIDGIRLASLMIEYDIGVSTEKVIKIKKIDTDFFNQE